MFEIKFILNVLVVNVGLSRLVTLAKLNGFVFHGDGPIGAVNAVYDDLADFFVGRVLHNFLLFKDERAWLIIIEDGDSSARIFARESFSGGLRVQLDKEVLIGFPTVVIDDLNFDVETLLTASEFDFLVDSSVIFSIFSVTIDGADPHGAFSA